MLIPIMNVAGENAALAEELTAAVARVFEHGQLMLGPEVGEFEDRVAELLGTRHAIGVNSGTDALVLTMKALGIGPGREVMTTPNTFIATVGAIRQCGATAVLVDVDGDENIDPTQIEPHITPRTAAIIPVHLRGRPARMDRIMAIAERHHLAVIEDASQAFGARFQGRCVGSFGIAGCFSLHPQKVLAASGDAGVIATDDDALAGKIRLLRHHGLRTRDQVEIWGQNSRLDSIQAAILNVKLNHLDAWIARRREVAEAYRQRLRGLDLVLPEEGPGEFCVYYHFSVFAPQRDALLAHLQAHGVDARVHYPTPIHKQKVAGDIVVAEGGLPAAERQSTEQLSLPIYPGLTPEQLGIVVNAVRAFHTDPRRATGGG